MKSIDMADEDKVRRRQRKGVITRRLSTLERLVVEEDGDAVQNRLDCIQKSRLVSSRLHMISTITHWRLTTT